MSIRDDFKRAMNAFRSCRQEWRPSTMITHPTLIRDLSCNRCGNPRKNYTHLCLKCFNKEMFKNIVGTDYLIMFNDEKCTGSWLSTSFEPYHHAYLFAKEEWMMKFDSFNYPLGPCTKGNYYREAHQKARQVIKSGVFNRQKLAQRMK